MFTYSSPFFPLPTPCPGVPAIPGHVIRSLEKCSCVNKKFKEMIVAFEMKKPNNLTVQGVSAEFQLQSRRVHDFFNILVALEVCSTNDQHTIRWNGVDCARETIAKTYIEFEAGNQEFINWFSIGESPTLGLIATRFMCLYFALGVTKLPMHSVSSLFSGSITMKRSLERRMYLVLSILELLGFITHVRRTGRYILAFDPADIIDRAIQAKHKKLQKKIGPQIEFLLNSLNGPYMDEIREKRRSQFAKYTSCTDSFDEQLIE